MNNSIKERTIEFVKFKGITMKSFETKCGLSSGYVTSMRKGFGSDKLNDVLTAFPELNRDWLLYGEGSMLKDENVGKEGKEEHPNLYTAPLLPISAQGGTLNDFVLSVKITDCEQVVTPIRDVDFVITVTGDSMAPDYPNGSQVLIKKVNEKAFIEWGRVYVLDTCNGSVIKEVRKGNDDDSVMCYSLNPDPKYQPFIVRFSDIYGMYRVLMCMALK